jgi:hypothetical protein
VAIDASKSIHQVIQSPRGKSIKSTPEATQPKPKRSTRKTSDRQSLVSEKPSENLQINIQTSLQANNLSKAINLK